MKVKGILYSNTLLKIKIYVVINIDYRMDDRAVKVVGLRSTVAILVGSNPTPCNLLLLFESNKYHLLMIFILKIYIYNY